MGGLVIDAVIAYLIKSALRFYRFWGSHNWKSVRAKIDSSWLDGSFVWNCYEADVATAINLKVRLTAQSIGSHTLVRIRPNCGSNVIGREKQRPSGSIPDSRRNPC